MQPPDHLERKWPSAIEHFVHAISAADEGNKITWLKPILVHVILDRFNRVGEIKRIMLPLPVLRQGDEHIKPIAPGSVALRRHQDLDFLEDSAVITMGLDRCDVHGFRLQTVCASILNDTLLFLQAADTGSVMISRNSRDLDLLLQLKPQAGVLLYDKS